MKQTLKPNGYLKFNASLKFDKFTVNSHRFIWFYLKGEIPKDKCVNHKNFIRSDNRIENLELLSLQENMVYSAERGRLNKPKNKGEKNSKAKLNEEKVLQIFYSKETTKDICKKFGIGSTAVYYIKQKKAWKHLWEKPVE